ncbi:MAG: FAD-binding oxidoreductase [Geminicoccaceae bacterium]|nr:MAG: FAD-binding oxidoreductase [Geminicoccaceae bacterium]
MTHRLSWGRAHRYAHDVRCPSTPEKLADTLRGAADRPWLAYGLGRSYGDSCLNADGVLVDMTGLDHFQGFDATAGRLRVEAGVRLADIVNLLARQRAADGSGWFLPVSPGTAFVTVGGAIANDVHGKNHHLMGTFGSHVRSLRLWRSDGRVVRCSLAENPELFHATIGGLGLTGIVLDAELQLRRVPGLAVVNEDVRFADLDAFYALSAESVGDFEYIVAWIDCLAKGRSLGRGIFSRANHVAGPGILPLAGAPRLAMPVELPVSPLGRLSIAAFNALYWRRFWPRERRNQTVPVTTVLYPLDHIARWNLLYGRRGFYQYQCVLPPENARDAVRELLGTIAAAGDGSFLAVLKILGDHPSPGLLSFPMPGTTLALDFSNRGTATLALLDRLDRITELAGGRLYPAKDGRMSGATFRFGYPALDRFAEQIDPAFSSSFWRRVADARPTLRSAA